MDQPKPGSPPHAGAAPLQREDELRREIDRLRAQLAQADTEIEAGLASVTELYEELATLNRLGETFARTTDCNRIIEQILLLAVDTIGSDYAFTLIPAGGGGEEDAPSRFAWGPSCRIPGEPQAPVALLPEETLLLRALGQASALIVNDFAEDQRLDSPLCRRLGLERTLTARFGEAASPGLLILGRRAGGDIFTAGNAKLLSSLAGALSNFLENDRLRRQELEQQRTEQQLEIARNIQMMLLPKSAPPHAAFVAAGKSTMARHVGGDYFHFHAFPDGRYGLMVADVSGKGVPAALLMTMLKGVLTGLPLDRLSPGETFRCLNEVIYREGLSDRFVTMAYAICDAKYNTLVYASAGHEPILRLVAATGEVRALEAMDLPLGLVPDLDFADAKTDFHPGDALVLYTDGVVEARDRAGAFYEFARLVSFLSRRSDRSAADLIAAIEGSVGEFVGGAEQFDDLTIATLHYAVEEKA